MESKWDQSEIVILSCPKDDCRRDENGEKRTHVAYPNKASADIR